MIIIKIEYDDEYRDIKNHNHNDNDKSDDNHSDNNSIQVKLYFP